MDKKKIMMILSIVVIVVCIGFSVYMLTNKDNDDSDGDKISNIDNKEILKDMKYDDMDIVGQLLDTGDGNSKYLARIVNNSGNDKKMDKLYVVFEFDNEKLYVLGLFDTVIANGSDKYVDLTIDRDLSKVKKISYSYDKNEEVEK